MIFVSTALKNDSKAWIRKYEAETPLKVKKSCI
jgi:hypothetical protein